MHQNDIEMSCELNAQKARHYDGHHHIHKESTHKIFDVNTPQPFTFRVCFFQKIERLFVFTCSKWNTIVIESVNEFVNFEFLHALQILSNCRKILLILWDARKTTIIIYDRLTVAAICRRQNKHDSKSSETNLKK